MMMSFLISRIKTLNYIKAAAVFAAGSFLILAMGTLHLAFAYKMGLARAFAAGFAPFAAAEAVKISAAALLFRARK